MHPPDELYPLPWMHRRILPVAVTLHYLYHSCAIGIAIPTLRTQTPAFQKLFVNYRHVAPIWLQQFVTDWIKKIWWYLRKYIFC